MQVGLTLAFNDTNQDGAVSMEEFISQSAAWVAQVDRDGDGEITSGDFGPQGS
jgi:Ca2+-binding EF-hand superfamily protein